MWVRIPPGAHGLLARPDDVVAQNVGAARGRSALELSQIDEQLDVVADDADSQAIRALVSETPGATFEANDARKHADAMRKHRQHVVDTIREMEARQDELLDKMNAVISGSTGRRCRQPV